MIPIPPSLLAERDLTAGDRVHVRHAGLPRNDAARLPTWAFRDGRDIEQILVHDLGGDPVTP